LDASLFFHCRPVNNPNVSVDRRGLCGDHLQGCNGLARLGAARYFSSVRPAPVPRLEVAHRSPQALGPPWDPIAGSYISVRSTRQAVIRPVRLSSPHDTAALAVTVELTRVDAMECAVAHEGATLTLTRPAPRVNSGASFFTPAQIPLNAACENSACLCVCRHNLE
jgi:hypothetical protein